MKQPVLVAGAGPTGLMAALDLARFGVPVRLIDKLAAPSTTSRALAVQARTLELFEQRGLADEMLRVGNKVSQARFLERGKPISGIELFRIPSRYNYILMLSQSETERILREAVTRLGVRIERPVELVAVGQTEGRGAEDGGVRAVLRHGDGALEEMDAAYLISAEGAHSSMRRTLNLQFAGKTLEQRYQLADLYVDAAVADGELSLFVSSDGFLGLFPMGNRHFRMIASEQPPDGKADSDPVFQDPTHNSTHDPTLEDMQRVFDCYAGIPGRVRDLVWSSHFRINTRMLKQLRAGRIFFGGDSAHVHSPAGGQGMNTGIQDMVDLSWKMAMVLDGRAADELLDTYGADRLPVIRQVLAISEDMTRAIGSDSRILHRLLTHVGPLVMATDLAQQKSTARLSQTVLNYRESMLSKNDGHAGALQAGDRVPELQVLVRSLEEAAGRGPVRLLEVLDPLKFTLLLTEEAEFHDAELRPWGGMVITVRVRAGAGAELENAFRESFGETAGMYLVRPDGYLGFVGGDRSLPALKAWMTKWFPPRKYA